MVPTRTCTECFDCVTNGRTVQDGVDGRDRWWPCARVFPKHLFLNGRDCASLLEGPDEQLGLPNERAVD